MEHTHEHTHTHTHDGVEHTHTHTHPHDHEGHEHTHDHSHTHGEAVSGEQAAALMLALAALCALPTLSGETRNDSYIPYGETVSSRQLYYTEYLLPDTDIEQIADVGVHTGGNVSLTGYHKLSTTVTAQVEARTDATVSLPLFGFDGYRATVDGQEMAVSLGENNRLTVSLPAGTSGALRVWFAGKGIWRVSDAVSLAALVACLACGLRRACMKRKKERA